MVCFGPTSSVVASLTLVGVFFFPGYLILQDSSSPSETTTATPYPTSPAVGPAFCVECPDCEGFVFGLFSFESIHPLGLVLLALALFGGFLFGRFYERRGGLEVTMWQPTIPKHNLPKSILSAASGSSP